MTVFQGDFGKGVATGSGVWSDPGANPCLIYGPQVAAGISNQGTPQPTWRLGMVVSGDVGSEFVYAKLVLAAVTDLLPGQVYQLDKDYNASLLTTGNSVLNQEAVVLNVWGPQVPAGTYFGWFQRAGRVAVQTAAASVATGFGETTATAGQLKFPAAPTVGAKSVSPSSAYQASSGITFTGNTAAGSPTITGVASINDLQLGQVITGANLPANAIIAAIRRTGSSWAIDIGINTAGSFATLQNATGSANGTTFTVTNMVTVNLDWPTLNKQN
ncbi:MAG TPA: hypothetical protein VKU90_08115 [Caulobacteraceae bacterium]|nr:hypothetical protein [Caulobacteraceae bacterium]